ncbi:Fe-S cluster assembly protein SufD [Candidatus Woesearchaeota archaeon]|nr:Fe-S cluster assembly protein SufD [Candidatus Woesearchaeota archaeon]
MGLEISILEKISKNLNEPVWLFEKRKQAFNEFENLLFPQKYGINISLSQDFPILTEQDLLEEQQLPGIIAEKNVNILPFSEALQTNELLIKENLFITLRDEKDKLCVFNCAFFNSGMLIQIPKGTILTSPIIINLDQKTKARVEHFLIIADENSKATIIENSSSKKSALRSQIVEIIAKESANISYISIQNFDKATNNYSIKKTKVSNNANVYWFDCCLGSKFTKSTITSFLEGEGASTKNRGIFLGDTKQVFDLNIKTIHSAPNTTCDMLTKGVLQGNAKTIYRGLIKILPEAHSSKGFQKADAILLNENAEIDPIPILEIHNDNVKCSHAAAVSHVNEDQIFYMMSRGLNELDAKKEIVQGFFEHLIKEINNKVLENLLRGFISKQLVMM